MSHFGAWKRGISAGRKRHETGRMNKLESAYADLLATYLRAGEIAAFDFEPMKLRLGDKCDYRIDFLVQAPDGTLEAHEVKGHWEDDARVKWRAAAERFSWLRFFAITREKGGLWIAEAAFIEDRDRAARYGAVLGSRLPRVAEVGRSPRAVRRIVSPPRKDV